MKLIITLKLVVAVRHVVRSACALATSKGLIICCNHFCGKGAVPLASVASIRLGQDSKFNKVVPSGCMLVRCRGGGLLSLIPMGPRRFVGTLIGQLRREVRRRWY